MNAYTSLQIITRDGYRIALLVVNKHNLDIIGYLHSIGAKLEQISHGTRSALLCKLYDDGYAFLRLLNGVSVLTRRDQLDVVGKLSMLNSLGERE